MHSSVRLSGQTQKSRSIFGTRAADGKTPLTSHRLFLTQPTTITLLRFYPFHIYGRPTPRYDWQRNLHFAPSNQPTCRSGLRLEDQPQKFSAWLRLGGTCRISKSGVVCRNEHEPFREEEFIEYKKPSLIGWAGWCFQQLGSWIRNDAAMGQLWP